MNSDTDSKIAELKSEQERINNEIKMLEDERRKSDLKLVRDLIKKNGFTVAQVESACAKGRARRVKKEASE